MRLLLLAAILLLAFKANALPSKGHTRTYEYYKISAATGLFLFDRDAGQFNMFHTTNAVSLNDSALLRYIYVQFHIVYFDADQTRLSKKSDYRRGRYYGSKGLGDQIKQFACFLVNTHNDTTYLFATVNKFKPREFLDSYRFRVWDDNHRETVSDTGTTIIFDTRIKQMPYSSLDGKQTYKLNQEHEYVYNVNGSNTQDFIDMVNERDKDVRGSSLELSGLLFDAPKDFFKKPGTYKCVTVISYLNGEQITDCNSINVE